MRHFCLAMALAVPITAVSITPTFAQDGPQALMDHGRVRQAAAAAESRLKSNSKDVESLRVLATIRALEKKWADAQDLAERAVAAGPNDADAHYALAQVAGMQASSASVLKKPGLAGKFKKEAEKALEINPNHEDAMEGMIAFHRQAPGIVGGDKKKGAAFADRLMKVNPTRGWLEKADNALDDKDSVLAESCLRKAVAVKGEPRAKVALASYLIQPWRKPDEAERLAREAADAEPWRVGGWTVLAMHHAYRKQWSEMDATLAKAETALSGNLSPHYQVARILITERTDGARAEALLRRYLSVPPEIGAPSYAGAHWRLGQALELQGKPKEAIAEFQTASKLDPKLEGPKKDLKRLKG